jgi:hypothetical protein
MWPPRYTRYHNDKFFTKGWMIKWNIQKVFMPVTGQKLYGTSLKGVWYQLAPCRVHIYQVMAAKNSCHLSTCSSPCNNTTHQVNTISLDPYQWHSDEPTSAMTRVVQCGAKLITWPSKRTFPRWQWESGSWCWEVIWLTCSDSNAVIAWQHD